MKYSVSILATKVIGYVKHIHHTTCTIVANNLDEGIGKATRIAHKKYSYGWQEHSVVVEPENIIEPEDVK